LISRQKRTQQILSSDTWVIEKAQNAEPSKTMAATTTAIKPDIQRAVRPSTHRSFIKEQISQEEANLAALTRDQSDLEQQIKSADPTAINQEMKTTQSEISSLQNQISYYQSGQAAVEQTATQQLQYLDTLSRQTLAYINSQIETAERELRIAQHDLLDANLNFDINDPKRVDSTQASIKQLQDQISSLQSQKEQVSAQLIRQIVQIKGQADDSANRAISIQNAIRSQINFLQNILDQLQDKKARSAGILDSLNREVSDRVEHAKNIQGRIDQLKAQLTASHSVK